jgi:amidophosphoribosyltransferase
MSDPIRHECGIAVVRLKKPLGYYHTKYGNALYGFDALQALMQKVRNRGQDGFGIGCCKLDMPPGSPTCSASAARRASSASARF